MEESIMKLEAITMDIDLKQTNTFVSKEVIMLQNELILNSQFKRDFNKLTAVPGRLAVEIGINLRDSIPTKYIHIIKHLETSQHERMIEIL